MKTIIYIVLMLFFITNSCAQQKSKIGMVEKFDLIVTENGTKDAVKYINDWYIVISPYHDGYQYEYAPAEDFYVIQKRFYSNGFIKERGKMLGRVKFGIWEYFDENGKLKEVVDEDKKFGKIKPNDVVEILNKNEVINTQEGTSATTRNKKYNTTGEFYASIINSFVITFEPARKEITTGQELVPLWAVSYSNSYISCDCFIDGDTGEFFKTCADVIYYE